MEPRLDRYEEGIQVYIRIIEHDSPEAAAAIRRIYATAGAQAAMRTALVLIMLKNEVPETHTLPNLKIRAYLFREYPEALPEFEQALAYCVSAWGLRAPALSGAAASRR